MARLKARDYASTYRDGVHRIVLIGMEFGKQVRNLVGFAWEVLEEG